MLKADCISDQRSLSFSQGSLNFHFVSLHCSLLLPQRSVSVPSLSLSSNRSPDLNVRWTLKEEIGGLERKLEESNALNESLRRQLTAVGPHKFLTRIRWF